MCKKGSVVYLAMLEDRHCDVQVQLFTDLEGAQAHVTKLKDEYRRYGCGDEEWIELDVQKWEYFIYVEDDGPSIRIEKVEIQ